MVIKMKKKTKKQKIDPVILVIIIVVAVTFIAVIARYFTNSQLWLECEKDITEEYNEVIKFKYDTDNNLYAYERTETLHNMSEETLNTNVEYFQGQIDTYKESLSDNFKYYLEKQDDKLIVKTYIGVAVFPSFFDQYMGTESITSKSKINNVKSFLEDNNYKCKITRK